MKTKMRACSRDAGIEREYWQRRFARVAKRQKQDSGSNGTVASKESGKSAAKQEPQSENGSGRVDSAYGSEECSPALRTRSRTRTNVVGGPSNQAATQSIPKNAIKTEKNGTKRERAAGTRAMDGNDRAIPGNPTPVKVNPGNPTPVPVIQPVRGQVGQQNVDLPPGIVEPAPVPQPYTVNEMVLCSDQGRMYAAKVLAIKRSHGGNEYRVHFHGWKNNYDEWVTERRLQPYDESKLHTAVETGGNQDVGEKKSPMKKAAAKPAGRKTKGNSAGNGGARMSIGGGMWISPSPGNGNQMSTGGAFLTSKQMLKRMQERQSQALKEQAAVKSAGQKTTGNSTGNLKRKAPARMTTGGMCSATSKTGTKSTPQRGTTPAIKPKVVPKQATGSATPVVKSAGNGRTKGQARMTTGGCGPAISKNNTKCVRRAPQRAATPAIKRRGEIEPERPNDSYTWLGCYVGKKLQSFPEPKRSRVEAKLLQLLAEEADEEARDDEE